jgi:hypothetical protein
MDQIWDLVAGTFSSRRRGSQGRVRHRGHGASETFLKPGLSSSQFAQASCKQTLPISFRPNWQCTRLAKGCSSSVVVRVRTTKEQQVAHAGSLT